MTIDAELRQNSHSEAASPRAVRQDAVLTPLVVDLDGTLTPTDTLIESVIQMLRHSVIDVLKLPFMLLHGRAAFKEYVASKATFSAARLPYRAALLDYLRIEREKGRRLILATGAHQSVGVAVAEHLALFDDVIASDGLKNMKGLNKLDAIRKRVGAKFVYAGDSAFDLPIWNAAEAAILVAVFPRVAKAVRYHTAVELELPRPHAGVVIWLRALRVHQWLKNLLLFVPLLTAFSFVEADKLGSVIVAFFAFCLAASGTYIVNDILDLDSDRAHPRKRHRPFASAQISIASGMLMAAGALGVALFLAAAVSQAFLLVVMLYLGLTVFYSWVLKQFAVLDVLTLAMLYTLRIIGGSVAATINTSSWLLAFSVFIFLSLALVKRSSELVSLEHSGQHTTPGRDYRVSDLVVLWPLGVGSGLCAVVVFGLFISAAETQARYASPHLLWFVAICLIYWLSRLWIHSARGEMHDDPLVFAIRDVGSRMTVLAMIAATIIAKLMMIG